MHNLLTDPIIRTCPPGSMTLPGVLAALSRDEIDSYPAMRPHQGMFWHMFCVQLAAMALKGQGNIPQDEDVWRDLLRAMTPEHPDDAPWSLVVVDWTKPAFMQAAVPDGVELKGEAPTPDALDILITAKNHDLKQSMAVHATAEDWLFALVTLQTGAGFDGSKNYGIARMNGGSSSRTLVGLAPIGKTRSAMPRPGAWFDRDVRILLNKNTGYQDLGFKTSEGLGLTWLAPWFEGDQLQLSDLDQFFIEICRRVRLMSSNGCIAAQKGNSNAARMKAKHLNGAIGDPWAPVHRTDTKSLTIGENGDFDYEQIMDLMFSGDWERPLLAGPAEFEKPDSRLTLVTQALARGNSKTGGFRCRTIPVAGKVVMAFRQDNMREELHLLSKKQAEDVKEFSKILGHALVIAVARGDADLIKRDDYNYAKTAQSALSRYADMIFFQSLWRRFEERDGDAEGEFIRDLWRVTQTIFERALPTISSGSLMRPKAEARARDVLNSRAMKNYSGFLKVKKGDSHAE